MQSSLVPVRIIQQLPSNQNSADLKVIGRGDDGRDYALKRLEDDPLLPISEWVGYQLSRAIGLHTPDFAVVWLDETTPAFGSRWEVTEQVGVPLHPVELAKYFGGAMRPLTEPIFAVDAFLPNEDRHPRNFMWRSSAMGPLPLAFDFSRAWLMTGLPFGISVLSANCNTLQMWAYLQARFGYQAPAKAIQTIAALPDNWLQEVLSAAPTSWLASFDVKPTMDFWVQHRQQRCAQALSQL